MEGVVMPLSKAELEERSFKLGLFFKPTTPINKESLFAGRKSQTRDVVDAINQQGQHAALYGDRGVGKTSLANMIFPKLKCVGAEILAPLVSCMSEDTYPTLWKRVFERIQFLADEGSLALTPAAEDILREYTGPLASEISPDEVWRLTYELGQTFLTVIILDEFDSLKDPSALSMMSDTIKFLSDRTVPVTVVVIGVADDVEALVANHRSVERCLSQIKMPPMSLNELESIVTNGLAGVEMTIEDRALGEISRLSKGLPHYAHLLGLYAGRAALDAERTEVLTQDVQKAMELAVNKTQATIQTDYSKAVTSSRKDAQYAEVLLACALAPTDNLGWFYPRHVRIPLSRILGKECKIEAFARHLHSFCEPTRGPILRKDEESARPRYRFVNPLIQPYILMRGLAETMITDADLKAPEEEGTLFN
jgi:Cdc6-like AAA superfamily ATPase